MKGLMHSHFGLRRRDVMHRVSRRTGLRLVDISILKYHVLLLPVHQHVVYLSAGDAMHRVSTFVF